jgi:DNA-binding NtrC family response regulator
MGIKILRVGADAFINHLLRQFQQAGLHDFVCVETAEEALAWLANQEFDVVLTDLVLPGLPGLEFLTWCQQQRPALQTIALTEPNTLELAVQAIKHGASEVFAKPLTAEALAELLDDAAERIAQQLRTLDKQIQTHAPQMVAQSLKMRKLLDQAAAIAPFNTTVLITGESGTGKELIARTIHDQSARAQGAFVALNCAAIPDQLLEDELFGHVKGAFTGAQTTREGRFELAHGGTLFLDEIGDMSLPLQAKLLRVLQEREFEKLGSSRTVRVDVRIVAATSADLEQKIKEGTFRLDLFYRLNVVHLRLAPLRERTDDVRPLAEQLLHKFCASAGLPAKRIDEEAMRTLLAYHWPGNVRQLQNAMECAAALSGAAPTIYTWNLPEEIQLSNQASQAPASVNPLLETALLAQPALPIEGLSLDAVVTSLERELLLRSLNQTGGNKMQAAKLLKMKRTTFVEKLKRLQIEEVEDLLVPDFANAPADFGKWSAAPV